MSLKNFNSRLIAAEDRISDIQDEMQKNNSRRWKINDKK